MKRCGAVLLAAIALAGCAKPRTPGVYDLTVGEAYQRLVENELKDLVYARQCGILIHVSPEGLANNQVVWHVRSSGQEVLQFTALLTPVGDKQTKVDIQIPPGPDGKEAYSHDQFYTRPAFNQPLRPAIDEQIAAILEGRPFDVSQIGAPTDSVCNAQRGGLETGARFRVDDKPGEGGY
ncbi:hypothetical protein QO010_001932 [Caulobacter ginsengisoli]|uniref:Lipoprotein n=1 Tax=Caulobacter ginsengisoli TaxID=400775 RepID=A0ABU0IS33_9CAUL|nr:hypothetical protein [Caulobacter ginsengisoli]MDQ0464161.1 hypothetical protein [Caulobacter ginsengisoli]